MKIIVAVSVLWAAAGTCLAQDRGIEAAIEALLQCASEKSPECLSRQAIHPDMVYATDYTGARIVDPDIEVDAFSEIGSASLYRAATERDTFSHKVFQASPTRYDVVFYRRDRFPADVSFERLWNQSDIPVARCEFLRVQAGWRLTDSICGIVNDD